MSTTRPARVRLLILIDGVCILAVGLFLFLLDLRTANMLGFAGPVAPDLQQEFPLDLVRFLGVGLIALALCLFGIGDLVPVCNLKRLTACFMGLHVLGMMAAAPEYQGPPGVIPRIFILAFHLGMASAFFYLGFAEESGEGIAVDGLRVRSWLGAGEAAAAQEERKRLARDLHDSIKQQLFSIKVGAAAVEARWDADPQGARSALADVRESAHAALVEMQALLRQLRPNPLEMIGLVEALREQCEALEYRSGARVELEIDELPAEERLPEGTQEHVFRIAQESLSNVARHARAHHVHVRLASEEDRFLVFKVRDDGQGFLAPPPGAPGQGMGLRNLRERAGALRGSLDLESEPGQGTSLEIRLPLVERVTPVDGILEGQTFDVHLLLVASLFSASAFVESGKLFVFWVGFGLWSYLKVHMASSDPDIGPEWAARLRHLTRPHRALFFAQGFWASPWLLQSIREGKDSWGVFGLAVALAPALLAFIEANTFFWKESKTATRPRSLSCWGLPTLSVQALLISFILGPSLMLALSPEHVFRGSGIAVGLLYLVVLFRRWFSGQEDPYRPGR